MNLEKSKDEGDSANEYNDAHNCIVVDEETANEGTPSIDAEPENELTLSEHCKDLIYENAV